MAAVSCDLHVHSKFSRESGRWVLRSLKAPESFTPPELIYELAVKRGMDYVTITDINTIEGALSISRLPGTFISEEVRTFLPGTRASIHILVFNITPEQWGVLNWLWEEEGIHQNVLARKTEKDKHTITRMLKLLEKNRLIERRPDPDDRRRTNVYLTEEGRALKRKLTPVVMDFLEKSFQGLTHKDLREFMRLHARITKNLDRLLKG